MKQVIYAKITKERKKEFQICTKLVLDGDKKYAEKTALFKEGNEHLAHMKDYAQMFCLENIRPVSCEVRDGSVFFPYIEGRTLSEIVLEAVKRNDKKDVYNVLFLYRDMIYCLGQDSGVFCNSEGFEHIFGSVDEKLMGKAGRFINIDNILENIIKIEDHYEIIDYEWFFDFYIPYDFVIYRAVLDLFINYSDIMTDMFSLGELLGELDISEEQAAVFQSMNTHFNDYVFDNRYGYQRILRKYEKNKLKLEEQIRNNKRYAQLYFDMGDGFSEENSIIKEIFPMQYGNNQVCTLEWELPEEYQFTAFRIDPADGNCKIKNYKIEFYNRDREIVPYDIVSCNGCMIEKDTVLFFDQDPQIVLTVQKEQISLVRMTMQMLPYCDGDLAEYYNQRNNYIDRLKYNNNELLRYVNSIVEGRN